MRKIGEVLRLRAAGMSQREIAQSVGIGQTTVNEYLARAQAAGLSWPLPAGMEQAAVEQALFPVPSAATAESRPLPDWRRVNRELKKGHGVTLKLLWLEWREQEPEGFGYSQFCYHYDRWLAVRDPVLRMEYAGGKRLFVDFTGDRMRWYDAERKTEVAAEIFVSALGASGLIYAEATPGQDLESWVMAHAHAFEFYGGVPEAVVPDNLKSGVTRACWYDPDLNPTYLELARRFDTVILPTRAGKPRDKGAVEAAVQVAERWVIAPLRNRHFFSLAELNRAVRERVDEVNRRAFRGVPTSRRDLFEEVERAELRPLPSQRYEFQTIKRATVNIDYHIEFDGHLYSVPYRLVKEKVEVWSSRSTVEIHHRGQRVASHLRAYGKQRYITTPDHRPASHRAHLEWSPSRLVQWAAGIGPSVAEAAEVILDSKPHPEHGYRACLGLMSLAKRYGEERLGNACARALVIRSVSYTSVKSILAENLDRQPLPPPQLSLIPAPPTHANLRGPAYYTTEKDA